MARTVICAKILYYAQADGGWIVPVLNIEGALLLLGSPLAVLKILKSTNKVDFKLSLVYEIVYFPSSPKFLYCPQFLVYFLFVFNLLLICTTTGNLTGATDKRICIIVLKEKQHGINIGVKIKLPQIKPFVI